MRELDRRRDLAEPEVEAVEGARRIVDNVHVLDAHDLKNDLEDFTESSGLDVVRVHPFRVVEFEMPHVYLPEFLEELLHQSPSLVIGMELFEQKDALQQDGLTQQHPLKV